MDNWVRWRPSGQLSIYNPPFHQALDHTCYLPWLTTLTYLSQILSLLHSWPIFLMHHPRATSLFVVTHSTPSLCRRYKRFSKRTRQMVGLNVSTSRHCELIVLFAASKYRVEDHKVPVEGAEILVRAIIPTPNPSDANESQTYPLMVWMHPGGTHLASTIYCLKLTSFSRLCSWIN